MKKLAGLLSVTGKIARRVFLSEYLVLLLCVIYFLALLPFAQRLGSVDNLISIASNTLPLLIVAMGQTVVLISGGIDLSVTAIVAMTSMMGAFVMTGDGGWLAGNPMAMPAAIIMMLLVGTALGAFNGFSVAYLKIPPFMVTLTVMMFFSGLAIWSMAIWSKEGQSIGNLPDAFINIWNAQYHGFPYLAAVITIVLAVLLHLLLLNTLFGRRLYAVGHNMPAAVISGVPTRRLLMQAYMISGALAACASILYTARLQSGQPEQGKRILLDVVGATVIGGASLFGGKGKVTWTVFGVLFIVLIDNSLGILSRTEFEIALAKGTVILFAACLDVLRNRMAGKQ
jgi:ribose/xylose/arabinose/galactoside ABC-type transport system permease subunit